MQFWSVVHPVLSVVVDSGIMLVTPIEPTTSDMWLSLDLSYRFGRNPFICVLHTEDALDASVL